MDSNKKESVQKPSLASLMSDKTPKALAERNSAVRRMYKDTSKQPSKPKKVEKATAPKENKVTKAVKPRKNLVKKTASVKSTTTVDAVSATQKKSQKSALVVRTKKRPTNEILIETNINKPDQVVLPDRVSVRAQEKVLAILSTLTKDFKHSAEKVAYVSGFCFIIFGGYLSLSFSGVLPDPLTPSAAQVIGSTLKTDSVTKSTPSNTSQKPTFSLLDPVPPVIDSQSKHTIEVTNSQLLDARAYSLTTGESFDIAAEKVVDNTFRLTIDPDSLPSSRYVLKVTLESNFDKSKFVFKVGEFEITSAENAASPDQNATSTASSSVSRQVENEEEEAAEESEDTTEEIAEVEVEDKLVVTTPSSVLSEKTLIKVSAPAEARTVELYVRPLKSSTKRFIGLGEGSKGVWQYFFDTKNVPNGEYEIVARSKVDGTFLEASSNRVTIVNFTGSPTTPTNPTPEEIAPVEPEVEIDPSNGRSFSDVSLQSVAFEEESLSGTSTDDYSATTDIDSVIGLYKVELDDILKRYAVARQSEDALMLELVERELKDVKNGMVSDVLLDPALNDLGDDIETVLDERFADIKKRIDTFEELRRTATERATAIDRDGDGIADFDEVNLYQTDPDKSDTDNDGVTDGIEVMRGFDPLDPMAETVVIYEMPQDTVGLVEDDLLKIDAILPVIKTDDPTIAPTVQAEIRGKGLPNSFVTIYIFSTPTIVTVRTGEDGSFIYTFEKELEDGEHEAYVAVTDNSGAIMARSNPFRFIKEAEAFTPLNGSSTVTAEESFNGADVFGPFSIAVGLGVLSLGMILLILGATLRERHGFLMTTPKNDIATS